MARRLNHLPLTCAVPLHGVADGGMVFTCQLACAQHVLTPACAMTTINPYALETLSSFLKGKVIIVTGGNSGIGKAIVETIGRLGAKVVIDYRSHPEATEAIEEEIGELGGTCIGVQADVSKLEDLQRLINEAVGRYGRLDVMVNNAGIETRTSILDTTPDDFDKVLNVNLRGVFFATQYAAKQMIAQGGGGRVINISSVHEDWPMPNNTPYCVAKGGVRMLTRTAGVELAPHGVSIVTVGPGAVATPINDSTMNNPELLAKLNAAIPMGRMAQPEEIAKLVAFLASDSASYITATTIFADGGIMQSSPGL
jgi:glucose 1-dehydrogenase